MADCEKAEGSGHWTWHTGKSRYKPEISACLVISWVRTEKQVVQKLERKIGAKSGGLSLPSTTTNNWVSSYQRTQILWLECSRWWFPHAWEVRMSALALGWQLCGPDSIYISASPPSRLQVGSKSSSPLVYIPDPIPRRGRGRDNRSHPSRRVSSPPRALLWKSQWPSNTAHRLQWKLANTIFYQALIPGDKIHVLRHQWRMDIG